MRGLIDYLAQYGTLKNYLKDFGAGILMVASVGAWAALAWMVSGG